jgi:hypothetical protein
MLEISSAQDRPGALIFSSKLVHRVQLAAVHHLRDFATSVMVGLMGE